MNYRKNLKEFLAQDSSQAFLFATVILLILLYTDGISEDVFMKLFGLNLIGFYGEKLTNFGGLR